MAKSNKEIIVRVGANTAEFNRAMKNLNSGLGGMQKQLKSMGSLMAGAFSVGVITAAGSAVFSAMTDQEKANRKLMASVQGNAYAYDELSKQAEKLRQQTGVEDDAIMQIQQLGISAGHSTEFVKKLTNAAVQLSVKTGKDLQASYELLEKSTTGVGRALKVLGPEFASLTKEQLINGAAIDLVGEKYGTFAEDTALKNEILVSNFGELKEAIGYAFNEGGFSPALDMLNKMVLAATDLVNVFGKFGGNATTFRESKFVASGEDASFAKFKKNADEKIKADKDWATKAMPLLDAKLLKQQEIVDKTNEEFEAYKKSKPALGALHVQTVDRYNNMLLYQKAFVETTKKEIGYAQELQDILSGKKGKPVTPTETKAKPEENFASDNIQKSINLYERYTDIRQKGEKILTDSAKKELTEQEKAVTNWFNDTLKSHVDFIENKKDLDADYLDAYIQAQNGYYELTTDDYTKQVAAYQDMLDKKLISEQQFNDMVALLDAQRLKTGIENLSYYTGQAAALFEEQTVAFKALASAQALIDTYLAANAALSAMAGIPVVGPALGVVAAGVMIAAGLSNVAKINGIGLAEGGVVPDGYPNDSYPAMLTSKEIVVPAKKLPDFQNQQVQVYGVIKAGDIYLSSERGKYLTNRKG